MRLTSDQVSTILGTASRLSGEDAVVYLFGSRVDDRARGGDVDLLIEPPQGLTLLERARLKLELEDGLGLPVDVISQARDAEPTPLGGAQQRYLIRSPVVGWLGALAFSAAAWQLAARDEWIGSELCSKRT